VKPVCAEEGLWKKKRKPPPKAGEGRPRLSGKKFPGKRKRTLKCPPKPDGFHRITESDSDQKKKKKGGGVMPWIMYQTTKPGLVKRKNDNRQKTQNSGDEEKRENPTQKIPQKAYTSTGEREDRGQNPKRKQNYKAQKNQVPDSKVPPTNTHRDDVIGAVEQQNEEHRGRQGFQTAGADTVRQKDEWVEKPGGECHVIRNIVEMRSITRRIGWFSNPAGKKNGGEKGN